MGSFGAYIGGIYPRSEGLIKATRKGPEGLPQLYTREKERVIKLQIKAGLSYIADPLLDWEDMLRPFSRLDGLQVGPLTRFFENNTFYRRPIIIDKLRGGGGVLVESLSLSILPKGVSWKADLPDPYTFADLCDNRYYRSKEELMFDLAEMLARESQSLTEAGLSFIQLNAPSIACLKDRDMLGQIGDAVDIVARATTAKTYLHLYFYDVADTLPDLLDLKVDGIGIDFRATDVNSLKGLSFTKGLACGYVDARSTKMEAPEEISQFAERVLEALDPKEIYVCPNADLEFIPYAFANRKVARIGATLKILGTKQAGGKT